MSMTETQPQQIQIVDYVPRKLRKETVVVDRRVLLHGLREATAKAVTEGITKANEYAIRYYDVASDELPELINGIVSDVMPKIVDQSIDPEIYNEIIEREWSRALVRIDHPRRAIDACEDILLAAVPEIDVERDTGKEPGWWIRRRDLTAFICVEEAVTQTIPAFVDLITERLNAAKTVTKDAA